MKVKNDYGSVVVYWLDKPYWHKGMYFDTEIRIKSQLELF